MRGEQELVEAALTDARQTVTGWLRCTCPFCMDRVGKQDKRQSLSVKPGDWIYRCWRCHISGKLKHEPTGADHLAQPERDLSEFDLGPPETFLLLGEGPGAQDFAGRAARRYLLEHRRVPRSTWRQAGIGYCRRGRAARRIVVPVHPLGSTEWRGWVGRAWNPDVDLRYVYPPGMPRGQLLFNADALLVETTTPVLVVEGVFDALPHWPNAVACLGKPVESQVQMMKGARRPLLVALDGDAWSEGAALAMRLNLSGKTAASLRLPPRKDPGDYRTADLRALSRLQAES